MDSTISELKINALEHAFLTVKTLRSASSFDVVVAKLSPTILAKTKINIPTPIIISGYKNAPKYKGDCATMVDKKNWINIKARFYIPPSGLYFPKGHRFVVRFVNNNKFERTIIDWE